VISLRLPLLVLAALLAAAAPAAAPAAVKDGCFVGIDVSSRFERNPSPCTRVPTPGPVSGPVAKGPGNAVSAFAGSTAYVSTGGPADRAIALPAPAVRARGLSDGSVWYSTGGRALGHIRPDGSAELVPTAAASTGDLAEGTGGVWFISGASIHRLGADGVRRFSTGGAFPHGLTAGPDGAIWFTAGGRIGRIDPASGALDFFATGGLDAAGGITSADGALWFTAPVQSQVARMTTSGQVTPYPTNGYRPTWIIAGPDQRTVWYTGKDYVGRMQTRTYTRASGMRFRCALAVIYACPHLMPTWPRGRSIRFSVVGAPEALAVGPNQRIYSSQGGQLASIIPFRGPLLCGTVPSFLGRVDGRLIQGACARPNPTFSVNGNNAAYVRLSCPRASLRLCAGTLTLYYRGQRIGKTSYAILSFDNPTVRATIRGTGLVARRRRIPVQGFVSAQDQAGLRASRWISFYLGPRGDGVASPVRP